MGERLSSFGLSLSARDVVERVSGEALLIMVNGEPWLYGEAFLPHLHLLQSRPGLLRRVRVDDGAARAVMRGAHVMRPGVTAVDDGVAEGELVAIVHDRSGAVIAVGTALLESGALRLAKLGRVVETLHWAGDRWWRAAAPHALPARKRAGKAGKE